jgi:ribosomal protein S16
MHTRDSVGGTCRFTASLQQIPARRAMANVWNIVSFRLHEELYLSVLSKAFWKVVIGTHVLDGFAMLAAVGTYNPIPNQHGEKLVTLNIQVCFHPHHSCTGYIHLARLSSAACLMWKHRLTHTSAACMHASPRLTRARDFWQRIKYWLVCGAQPTDRIATLLGNANILPAKLNYSWKEPKQKEGEKK